MATSVVPFRGTAGKTRLAPLADAARALLVEAMLGDVVAACAQLGPTVVVGPVGFALDGADLLPEPGGGQGTAVAAGLSVAASRGYGGPFLVVNSDLPCVTAADLRSLGAAVPPAGLALVAAADGTTNALGFAQPGRFRPLYGPGSASRFAALEGARSVECPNLADDVDSFADLLRLGARLGPRSAAALASVRELEAG